MRTKLGVIDDNNIYKYLNRKAMLESDQIQLRGFMNLFEKGKEATGFQAAIRSTYYRVVYLSQLRPATVKVDGEIFKGDQITWTIGEKNYTQTELANYSDVHWPITERSYLKVKKPGGLTLGMHEVEVAYSYTSSYIPPRLESGMARPQQEKWFW